MDKLSNALIKLGEEQPELREHIRPVLAKIASRRLLNDVLKGYKGRTGQGGRVSGTYSLGNSTVIMIELDLGPDTVLTAHLVPDAKDMILDVTSPRYSAEEVIYPNHLSDPSLGLSPSEIANGEVAFDVLARMGY